MKTSRTLCRSESICFWSNHCASMIAPARKGTHHVVQSRPVGAEGAGRQPDQPDIPAVPRRQPDHELTEANTGQRKGDQESGLLADALPVHEDDGKQRPRSQRRPSSRSAECAGRSARAGYRASPSAGSGSARPSLRKPCRCQARIARSALSVRSSRRMPACRLLRRCRAAGGTPSASPAVMPLSRRCSQTLRRSSSIPAIHTNTITAHQAMPFKGWITAGLNTNV